MCTATYAVTMAELKEPAHNNVWYDSSITQMSTSRPSHAGDAGLSNPPPASPHSGRPRQGPWGSVDHHSPYPSYPRYSQDETADPYDRHQQHSLTSQSSFSSLKRPYSATEQPPYQEMVQDLRDDGSKLGGGHDHKLLAFRKVADKHTILDNHGRMQQLQVTAQLHGMFFLSEMPAQNNDGSVLQPELTCYRRNLFQVSGSLMTQPGQMSVVTETGESVPVQTTEVTISAIESVDGHPVRLIVIPWKTPPPNSPEVSQVADQEPASLPLIPCEDDGSETDGGCAVYPIGWRRLQFRIATANNGRRKELQQHFVVHLKVMATLANGNKVVLAEAQTAPIVVRGRSPRNFSARKEIPLLGSSAGSRGQALVENGLGIVAGSLSIKPQELKARPSLNMEVPRTAFTFSAPKLPASPMSSYRSNSYPTSWKPAMGPASNAPNYPSTTVSTYASDYQKLPDYRELPHAMSSSEYTAEPSEMPPHLPTTMPSVRLSMPVLTTSPGPPEMPPIRTQYASYVGTSAAGPPLSSASATAGGGTSLSVPRYVDDSNPRPTKSPRHPSHPSIHGSISSTESAGTTTNNNNNNANTEYRYGAPSAGGGGGGAYGSISSASAENISPTTTHGGQHGQHHHSYPPHPSSQHESSSSTTATSSAHHPPRDYYPSAASWTTTSGGEPSAPSYANGDHRASYPYAADQYKTAGVKSDPHGPPAPVYPGQLNHYSWSTS